MKDMKTYTITNELYGTITGTEEQIDELVFAANAQAVHYQQLIKEHPKDKTWEEWWWKYSCASTDIWRKLQEAKKNESE